VFRMILSFQRLPPLENNGNFWGTLYNNCPSDGASTPGLSHLAAAANLGTSWEISLKLPFMWGAWRFYLFFSILKPNPSSDYGLVKGFNNRKPNSQFEMPEPPPGEARGRRLSPIPQADLSALPAADGD